MEEEGKSWAGVRWAFWSACEAAMLFQVLAPPEQRGPAILYQDRVPFVARTSVPERRVTVLHFSPDSQRHLGA